MVQKYNVISKEEDDHLKTNRKSFNGIKGHSKDDERLKMFERSIDGVQVIVKSKS
jgi:hypothetical protein